MKRLPYVAASALFGFIMFIFGLNKLYLFIPVPEQDAAGAALMAALIKSGYLLQAVAVIEMLCGLLILFRKWVLQAYLVLLPITINILLFHLFADQRNLAAGLLIFGLHVYLLFMHRKQYIPFLKLAA